MPSSATSAFSSAQTRDSVLNALPAAVLLLDARGRVDSVNDAARDWLGEPLIGQSWREVCTRDFRATLDGNDLQASDGRFVNISTRPLEDEPGQVILLADVSEARAMQRQVERNLRLAGMGEMLARLSHQIRTPLSAAILYGSQLNKEGLPDSGRRKASTKVLDRLHHMEQMVRDMLMFAHGAQFRLEPLSVAELLSDVGRQLEPHFDRRQAHFDAQCDAELQISGNRVGLAAALQNLAMNALENGPSGMSLQMSAEVHGDRLQLLVDDDGPGIPSELRDKILQPFYTTRSDGTGLGLPVVRSVVESHGGHLRIDASPQGGARFILDLPLMSDAEVEQTVSVRCA